VSKWNTSNVVEVFSMLALLANFSADLSQWDASNVQEMNNVFASTHQFNAKIVNPANWSTQNLESVHGLFCHARGF